MDVGRSPCYGDVLKILKYLKFKFQGPHLINTPNFGCVGCVVQKAVMSVQLGLELLVMSAQLDLGELVAPA
jgi:hypothetical protein